MSRRWHVVAWVGLVAGLAVWMWPLDPTVSFTDMAELGSRWGMSGSDPGNTLDAMFSDWPLEGTALLRLWVGGVLITGTVVTEVVLSRRQSRRRHDELPPAPSEARFGYSD